MRNVLDESCMENQKAHFVFNNFFPKIFPFMIECGKNMVEPDSLLKIYEYNTVHALCLLDN
jgi:hypothetical protein